MVTLKKYLPLLLSLVLLGGTLFSGTTIVKDFQRFYASEGTLLKIQDCQVPNPVTTACFYGTFAFLGAFIWSVVIPKTPFTEKRNKHQKYLLLFLIGGTLFAWFNFFRGLGAYLASKGAPVLGCSGQIMTNPINTPCFVGSVIFLIALIIQFAIFSISFKQKET